VVPLFGIAILNSSFKKILEILIYFFLDCNSNILVTMSNQDYPCRCNAFVSNCVLSSHLRINGNVTCGISMPFEDLNLQFGSMGTQSRIMLL
jgi:hypothetical protein